MMDSVHSAIRHAVAQYTGGSSSSNSKGDDDDRRSNKSLRSQHAQPVGASGGIGLTAAALQRSSKGIEEDGEDVMDVDTEDEVDVNESIFDSGGTATSISS